MLSRGSAVEAQNRMMMAAGELFQGFETLTQEQYYFKMVDRTFKLLVEQLLVYMNGLPQTESSLSKWTLKLLKSYKALRLMEVHKQAEPKFARTLKLLYPLLAKRHGADTGNAVMDLGNGLGGETIGSSADEAFVFGAGKPNVASSEDEDGSGDKAD